MSLCKSRTSLEAHKKLGTCSPANERFACGVRKCAADIAEFFTSIIDDPVRARGSFIDASDGASSPRKEKEPVENPRDSGSTQGDPTAESLGWHESRWSVAPCANPT